MLIALWAPVAWGAEAPETAEGAPGRQGRPPLRIQRAASKIAIDGSLDEPAWQTAATMELRYETRPAENTAPPVRTEIFLAYDEDHFYMAFRAHDPNPSEIRAHVTDRDKAFSDDFVGVVLDTFNDERRAFEFFVNPLGVQMDMFQDDVSGNEDESWDAIWDSAGKITASGFEVEIAIPWSSLRFPRAEGDQTWGFDALRFYPRTQRHRISSHPLDRNITCYLCQASKMTGFAGVTPGKNVEIAPTVTANRTDRREDDLLDRPIREGSYETELGLTAKWGITPSLTLNAAINPDFSQVEADAAQLDVNTQFALFFPEKRPFFLEGADFFRSPFEAVFTRNVANPGLGGQAHGQGGEERHRRLRGPGRADDPHPAGEQRLGARFLSPGDHGRRGALPAGPRKLFHLGRVDDGAGKPGRLLQPRRRFRRALPAQRLEPFPRPVPAVPDRILGEQGRYRRRWRGRFRPAVGDAGGRCPLALLGLQRPRLGRLRALRGRGPRLPGGHGLHAARGLQVPARRPAAHLVRQDLAPREPFRRLGSPGGPERAAPGGGVRGLHRNSGTPPVLHLRRRRPARSVLQRRDVRRDLRQRLRRGGRLRQPLHQPVPPQGGRHRFREHAGGGRRPDRARGAFRSRPAFADPDLARLSEVRRRQAGTCSRPT